jgi:hypothetical protein
MRSPRLSRASAHRAACKVASCSGSRGAHPRFRATVINYMHFDKWSDKQILSRPSYIHRPYIALLRHRSLALAIHGHQELLEPAIFVCSLDHLFEALLSRNKHQ